MYFSQEQVKEMESTKERKERKLREQLYRSKQAKATRRIERDYLREVMK